MKKKKMRGAIPWKTVAVMAVIGLIACAAAWMLESRPQAMETVGLRISEVMADTDGISSDWIEIENTSDTEIRLYGYVLASAAEPKKAFVFPNCSIAPGKFLVVMADGSNAGLKDGVYHAPFKLSSGSETIYLLNAAGNTIDRADVPGLGEGTVYCRDENGDWRLSYAATPGAKNVIADISDIRREEAIAVPGAVEISEVCSKNRTYFPDENGEVYDYVELHNVSDEAVNLSGWYLSNAKEKLRRWALPEMTLAPDEYRAIHLSGLNRESDGHIHADFRLSSSGDQVFLSEPDGTLVSQVKTPALSADQAYSLTEDGWTTELSPTPDEANTVYGANALSAKEALGDVYISEIAACTSASADWIELKNASDSAIDLSGWGLSNNASRPRKWQFPNGTVIQPGQYLCVFADRDGNDDMVDPARAPRTNLIAEFNLSAAGGYSVVLSRAGGEIVDRMALPQQYRDISYGRKNDSAECVYFDQMTPGVANAGNTYLGRAETPVFSVSGGLFEAGDTIEVELSAPSDCRVYYTTDRTDPTENSNRYTSPIRISSQTVLRVRAYKDGCMPSYMDTQSYLFEAKNGGGSVYTVSIVSDPYNLTSDEAGILVKGSGSKPNYDQDWEREAHVEIYDPNGNLVVSQECGMRQQGQTCRSEPQQCFKLIARKEYGDDLFRGHIFTNRDYDVCRAILIRNSSDDANKTRMRDSVLQKLAEGTSVLYQETEVCVVYLNGEYWGHYNIREAVNPTLICLNEGWAGDENELDYVLKNNTLLQGSDDSFQNLLAYLTTNDPNTGAAYQMIDENIDIQNYIEYMSIQIFCGNTDPSNVKRYRNPNADGKWRWVLYDIDWSFLQDTNSIARWLAPGGVGNGLRTDNTFFIACMKNDTFRDRFLEYFGTQLATTMTTEHVLSMFQERYQLLSTIFPEHFERWQWRESKYQDALRVLISYAQRRPTRILQFLKYSKDLDLSQAQMEHYFGAAMTAAGLTYDTIPRLK